MPDTAATDPSLMRAAAFLEDAGPAKKKLSREDRLEIEVLAVKIQNMALQQQQMQRDIVESVRQRQAFQTELVAMQAKLGEKYGVDMTTVKIEPDGTLIEKTTP
jgi:hypothetical protein